MSLARNAPVLIEDRAKTADDLLLTPIAGSRPTGQDVRYSGDYDAIAEARRQDNAALPQGVWLRDLKRADWISVERLCVETLKTRSKDLQVASWLTEAWVHLQSFAGLARGFALLGELCEQFWPDLYPVIEEGDLSARTAPLEWLNEKLPDLLRSLPIVSSATDPEERFSWTDYMNAQRLETVRQRDAGSAERAEAGGAVTQARFGACRQQTATPVLKGTESALQQALRAFDALNSLLQQHCGKEAPGLGGIRTVAEEILAFLAVELADRQKPVSLASMLRKRTPPTPEPAPPSPATDAAATPQSPRTREEAYHQLSEIADFLLRTEPHSPTAYLIQRAAAWGEMPLPALVQQLSQSGSDISRLLDALGLLSPEEEIDHDEGYRQ
jgi:type VI secretion system ImpA family protein